MTTPSSHCETPVINLYMTTPPYPFDIDRVNLRVYWAYLTPTERAFEILANTPAAQYAAAYADVRREFVQPIETDPIQLVKP